MKEYLFDNDLIMDIYTIGYEPMGESIVIIIKADDICKFCGIIDYYEFTPNKVIEILDDNKIDKIDMFCITHPHKDHCYEIDKLLKKITSQTVVAYPLQILCYKKKFEKNVIKSLDNSIAKYIKMNSNNQIKPILRSCNENTCIIDNVSFKDRKEGFVYPFGIDTYAPISTVIDRYSCSTFWKEKNCEINENIFSIVMSIYLGDFKLLLCSDVMGKTIELIPNVISDKGANFFKNRIDYLKIPHHSSEYSANLIEILLQDTKIFDSVTTVYRSSNLPAKAVLDKYKVKSDKVYSTGNIERGEGTYGILHSMVNIKESTIKEELIGEAIEYF
ncbi:MAG: hypothetical protein E7314_02470 [Clostridiales bacterium]|nr:hypothetical protein [Clostridiales bacterium]